ncbi:hypothetical protein GDO78_006829 [Eleutherodactylus coqui]|uniref:Secreted protein n=1 Tax=Eleutherodactylus coqui TaxID=57060 RepID=A0A8J6FFJ8_ELECQ|nr:hypothetical protein GDO78_006829 [Eleutherodactylus coqui]
MCKSNIVAAFMPPLHFLLSTTLLTCARLAPPPRRDIIHRTYEVILISSHAATFYRYFFSGCQKAKGNQTVTLKLAILLVFPQKYFIRVAVQRIVIVYDM